MYVVKVSATLTVFFSNICQDLEREMQLDLAHQLEQLNKEMDEMLMVDLQVGSVVTVLFFLMYLFH